MQSFLAVYEPSGIFFWPFKKTVRDIDAFRNKRDSIEFILRPGLLAACRWFLTLSLAQAHRHTFLLGKRSMFRKFILSPSQFSRFFYFLIFHMVVVFLLLLASSDGTGFFRVDPVSWGNAILFLSCFFWTIALVRAAFKDVNYGYSLVAFKIV